MTDADRIAEQRQRRAARRPTRRPGRSGQAGGAPAAIAPEEVTTPAPALPGTVGAALTEHQRQALARLTRAHDHLTSAGPLYATESQDLTPPRGTGSTEPADDTKPSTNTNTKEIQ